MSLPRKNVGEFDDENISSPDDNNDNSTSAEVYEAARRLEGMEEPKKLVCGASDADVSGFSSPDSTQTVIATNLARKLATGSKLQRSPKQKSKKIKFDEECKVKRENEESSDEKVSKLCVKKDKKSPRKRKLDTKKVLYSTAGCSSGQGRIIKAGLKRSRSESDEQMESRSSSSESETKSLQDRHTSSNIAGNISEVTKKKIIAKKSPEKLMKTRLGSSEIAADVIEDAIDHTDDSVFTNVGSSEFTTVAISNTVHNTETLTDITENAVDHTDQAIFTKVSSSDSVAVAASRTIHDSGIVTDLKEDSIDHTDGAGFVEVKSADLIAAVVSNILQKEASNQSQIEERSVQEQSDSQKLDFQELRAGEVIPATISSAFSQVSRIEVENISGRTTEPCNPQNLNIEKTESTSDSSHSDERMEFSNESTIPSGIGYNTDVEKMECGSDTYSGLESFKIDSESDTTVEKMDWKSESSASRDKMETESFSVKSNETELMEFSSESIGYFKQESIKIKENESISVQENESISVQENESISVQENESIGFQEYESIGVQESASINFQGNESIGDQENESLSVQEKVSISVPKSESISVQESESISILENESIKENEFIGVQETESSKSLQQEKDNQILESKSCTIGGFVTRSIQESIVPIELVGNLDHAMIDNKNTFSNESDSNSNEVKAIYESNTDPDLSIERKFTIPRKQTSDTDEYEDEQKQVVDKEAVDEKLSSRPSFKRSKSIEEEKKLEETTASVPNTSDVQKQAAFLADLSDTDSDEFKDSDDIDRKRKQ